MEFSENMVCKLICFQIIDAKHSWLCTSDIQNWYCEIYIFKYTSYFKNKIYDKYM